MRTMTRNRQVFWEAKLLGAEMGQDADGNYVEETFTYSKPSEHNAPITAASGEAQTQLFGANEVYDKVITLNLGEDYLDIASVLWIDTPIELDENGNLKKNAKGEVITPYNYVVVKVAKSLNFISVAIRKVDVR